MCMLVVCIASCITMSALPTATISVHSKKSHPFTDTDTYKKAIFAAARDMREMFAPSS